MIFRRSGETSTTDSSSPRGSQYSDTICIFADPATGKSSMPAALPSTLSDWNGQVFSTLDLKPVLQQGARILVSFCHDANSLSQMLDQILPVREERGDGFPVLVIAQRLHQLRDLGTWLHTRASADSLSGIRLMLADSISEVFEQLPDKLQAITDPNVIKMPVSTEVECKDFKYYYAITPELRKLTRTIRQLAENNITRIYLLGGPGTGKTSLAYHYFLCRKKGNFVTVNLTAESTGDKESMKSLLCGHVSGALGGGGAREGALSYAGDGVAFLDESHGVTGIVMQVLMEVLDSGQFLPFGAVKKRSLDCAVIFASNRSWEALRNLINLDEHARLGATLLHITDLASRQEDLIAVLATTLAKFSRQCVTWKAPVGLSPEAWSVYKNCPWRGNTRTLIRVTEAACVSQSLEAPSSETLEARHVEQAIDLWEPADHHSHEIYTSFRGEQT